MALIFRMWRGFDLVQNLLLSLPVKVFHSSIPSTVLQPCQLLALSRTVLLWKRHRKDSLHLHLAEKNLIWRQGKTRALKALLLPLLTGLLLLLSNSPTMAQESTAQATLEKIAKLEPVLLDPQSPATKVRALLKELKTSLPKSIDQSPKVMEEISRFAENLAKNTLENRTIRSESLTSVYIDFLRTLSTSKVSSSGADHLVQDSRAQSLLTNTQNGELQTRLLLLFQEAWKRGNANAKKVLLTRLPSGESLLGHIVRTSKGGHAQRQALMTLDKLGEKARPTLQNLVKDGTLENIARTSSNQGTRRYALLSLARIGDDGSREVINRLRRDGVLREISANSSKPYLQKPMIF